MRKAAAASVGDLVAAYGTLVARYIYNLYNVRIALITAHCDFYSLGNNCPLLIYAASRGRLFACNDAFRYIHNVFKQLIIPRKASHFTKNFIF